MKYILREITPLAKDKLYFAKHTPDDPMDFPLHFHEDFELTLALHVAGKRIVGNLVEPIADRDLVLIGPDVLHCYRRSDGSPETKSDLTVIQFSRQLAESELFDKDTLRPIGQLLSQATIGVRFSERVACAMQERLLRLPEAEGLHGVLLFLEILYELAVSSDQTVLSNVPGRIQTEMAMRHCIRINKIIRYVQVHYMQRITLDEIGALVQMSPSSVSRFFKHKTQHNFWDYLNNYRVGRVAQRMVECEDSISEICYGCGFNNVSNFNRIFREQMGVTPSEYRRRVRQSLVAR